MYSTVKRCSRHIENYSFEEKRKHAHTHTRTNTLTRNSSLLSFFLSIKQTSKQANRAHHSSSSTEHSFTITISQLLLIKLLLLLLLLLPTPQNSSTTITRVRVLPNLLFKGLGLCEKCGMFEALMKFVSFCWKPFVTDNGGGGGGTSSSSSDGGSGIGRDGLLWFYDIGKYAFGDFSMAVVQANQVLEDQSQIESGPFGTFVGVYDGHGGPEAARYVCDHLFRNFREISERQGVTSETIQRAFLETEEGFTALVSEVWNTRPNMASVGACCLVGVICQQTLYIANLGDSRCVLGKKVGNTGGIAAIQLSTEHNANMEAVRQELKESHPDDPQIVVLKHGVWRVKGIIQVSRSIGDVYMKHAQFNREPLAAKFRLPEPTKMPVMSANPSILSHPLQSNDSFLIFATDGLWEHLSNQTAVDIVHNHPRAGSAKRLIKAALQEAATKREMRYADLSRIDKKVRRHFHDDITVIVLFLNDDLISRGVLRSPTVSLRCALEH